MSRSMRKARNNDFADSLNGDVLRFPVARARLWIGSVWAASGSRVINFFQFRVQRAGMNHALGEIDYFFSRVRLGISSGCQSAPWGAPNVPSTTFRPSTPLRHKPACEAERAECGLRFGAFRWGRRGRPSPKPPPRSFVPSVPSGSFWFRKLGQANKIRELLKQKKCSYSCHSTDIGVTRFRS